MNLNEAATLLCWTRDQAREAVVTGIKPPGSTAPAMLQASARGLHDYDIVDGDLDAFILKFESNQPGRHPPTKVRRQLLVDARELCCICGSNGPFEYHHLIDWAKLAQHDPAHMMLLCRNCHGKCTNGIIDHQRQRAYKANPYWSQGLFAAPSPEFVITWDDLRSVVTALHAKLKPVPSDGPRYDYSFTEIERKNGLNNLSGAYFETWRTEYEPRLGIIKRFLGDGGNSDVQDLYFEVVGDLRTEISALQGKSPTLPFDDVLRAVFQAAFNAFASGERVNREVLRAVVAFMYFECDIGKK